MPARFAEEHQEAEDQQDRDDVPAAEQTGPAADRNWHVYAHARCPAVTQRSKKPRPRPIEAACDRDHITPTLCHSNHFAARPTIPPPLSRLEVINSRSRDAVFVRTRGYEARHCQKRRRALDLRRMNPAVEGPDHHDRRRRKTGCKSFKLASGNQRKQNADRRGSTCLPCGKRAPAGRARLSAFHGGSALGTYASQGVVVGPGFAALAP